MLEIHTSYYVDNENILSFMDEDFPWIVNYVYMEILQCMKH